MHALQAHRVLTIMEICNKVIMKYRDGRKAEGRKKSKFASLSILLALSGLFFCSLFCSTYALAGERVYMVPAPQPVPQYQYRYVAPKNWYGQRRAVPNAYEAGRIMAQYYQGRDVRIGPVIERDIFYQADVRDPRGVLVDKVIIDKRTGRMRSIY